jgi:uncharacterized membrane protein
MTVRPLSFTILRGALLSGWRMANATRAVSFFYAALFVALGAVIIGVLLARGWTPFVLAAAGAFMLVGPAVIAGFFGIADAFEAGQPVGLGAIYAGFSGASRALWALVLVCGLLFMIFVTDAAILYAYMVGGEPVWLSGLIPASGGVIRFAVAAAFSGLVVALLLYCVSAFAVPLLSARRCGLVAAVSTSFRVVFAAPVAALAWAFLLAALIIASALLLPLLPLTLPWLAYASRELVRVAVPER